MTEDKNIEKNLKLLDDILHYLIHNCTNYISNFDKLYKHTYSRDLSSDKEFHATGFLKSIDNRKTSSLEELFSIPISDNTRAQGEKLVEACYFLHKKELIRLDSNFNISATFDGLIEHSKGGLLKKFKSEKYKDWLDHFNVYVTIAISLASSVVGYLFGS
tara:strand:+ start:233 stop:712 length:480 start_codon:yes stop_codon:yes gene_type:complete